MYYLRKISRGKWPSEDQIVQSTLQDVQVDTVVAEFKTDKNKLSVWKVETEADVDDAFIALGSNCSNIGTIWAVKILPDDLDDIEFDDEEGNTPTIGINDKHCNITNLNYVSLGTVIVSVLNCLRSEEGRLVKKTKKTMRQLMTQAYSQNRLIEDQIEPNVLQEIYREMNKAGTDAIHV